MSGAGESFPTAQLQAVAEKLGCANPVPIKKHPQSIVCRVETPNGRAILKAALGRKGRRVLQRERRTLEEIRLSPPAAVPRLIGHCGDAMLLEEIRVPRFDGEEAKKILGREAIQSKLESLLLQLRTQKSGKPLLSRSLSFSHGDLSERNLLIDPNVESIVLIDFQEAGWRPVGYDLIHLCCHARQPVESWGWQRKLFARVWPNIHPEAGSQRSLAAARDLFIDIARRQLKIDLFLSRTNEALRPAYEEGARVRRANLNLFDDRAKFGQWFRSALDG